MFQATPPSRKFQVPPPSRKFQATPPSRMFQATPPSRKFQATPPSRKFQATPPSRKFQATPPRQRKTIGRLYAVSPRDQERFSLRTLLLYRKGCKSFADVRTVNGTVFQTYTETAKALDLLSDDSYFMRCMEESCLFQTPRELRSLFACMIAYTEMSNAEEIWHAFKNEMCFDFEHQNFTHEQSVCLAYYDILDKLAIQGINLTTRICAPNMERPVIATEYIDYDECARLGAEGYSKLNPAQRLFVDNVLCVVEQNQQKCIFLDGPGGSGKTFAYTTLYHILTGRHKKVLNVAWTGIAANLLPLGRTACSAFKIPISEGPRTSSIVRISKQARILKEVQVIVWDEAPMSPKEALEAVDLLLKDIMQNNQPFGGKHFILGGDFRQILPVVEHGGELETVQSCIKMSPLWPKFQTLSLTHNMRLQAGNANWANYLLQIGGDLITSDQENCIPVPEEILLAEDQSLIEWVFGDDLLQQNVYDVVNRTILTPRNEEALELNLEVLSKLPGQERIYSSVDEAITVENQENAFLYTPEFLHSLTPSGFPPHKIHLKQGAIVMLLRNIDVNAGLCNGTRLIVKQMGTRILGCEIATGSKKGNFVLIPKIDNYYDKGIPFRMRRRQFPIRLSFCMTINKAQGQTFEKVGVYLKDEIFAHGQLYVALSRVRSPNGIRIQTYQGKKTMRNVVYRNVL